MRKIFNLIILFIVASFFTTQAAVQIIEVKGDVKIRRGLDENWQPAGVGMLLEDIDTILTLEYAEVLLQIDTETKFRIISNSVLDIGDLRKITERELFLYLTSEKINEIEPRKKKLKLRIPNVSVVHGEFRSKDQPVQVKSDSTWWKKEVNGAQALYSQSYYPNTVVKLHKILNKYPNVQDCGEVHFYLGRTLEALEKPGQALDAYQTAIKRCEKHHCESEIAQQRIEMAQEAVKRLKK
ncbi:tetratricopeptide repeat protein [candidate division KSB1 bacterium]|nr:tetratricopeptide repeat protein [candidate division KSB1 bacterium]